MKRKLLLSGEGDGVKDIAIFEEPRLLRAVLNKMSWEILKLIGDGEMYPLEIAKKLGAHEQKVYYHIRKLAEAGILEVAHEETKKGATAKYYRVTHPSFGVELPHGGRKVRAISPPIVDEKLSRFLYPFIKDGVFDGKIVVGSPDPHGPFKARARDGHYASYLTLFFGQLVELPDDFAIKLDVDVKAEKEEGNNLIVIGGPGTNLITQEVNDFLPIKFNMVPSEHGYVLGGLV
jgi:DNA-binding transcriptional ArsR family regulator